MVFHKHILFIAVIPSGAIQISVNADGTPITGQGVQTLTMTNATPTSTTTGGATIVQYAQGPDGQQFYIPGRLATAGLSLSRTTNFRLF